MAEKSGAWVIRIRVYQNNSSSCILKGVYKILKLSKKI